MFLHKKKISTVFWQWYVYSLELWLNFCFRVSLEKARSCGLQSLTTTTYFTLSLVCYHSLNQYTHALSHFSHFDLRSFSQLTGFTIVQPDAVYGNEGAIGTSLSTPDVNGYRKWVQISTKLYREGLPPAKMKKIFQHSRSVSSRNIFAQ